MANYSHLQKNNNPSADTGGYKNVFLFAPRTDFQAIKAPIGGTVGSPVVSSGGTGYTTAPTVSFSGGGGTGAAATAVLTGGVVTSLTITNPGTGYTSAPTVSFSGGGGTGAAATVSANINLGDGLVIGVAHTFGANKGFFEWPCKTHSVTLKSTTVGDDGAKEEEWTTEFVVIGDSPEKDEQLRRILNDDVIALIKEADCLTTDSYVQLGNECVSPVFSVEFDGKTTKEGKKEYKVTVVTKIKYFYRAAVTKAA